MKAAGFRGTILEGHKDAAVEVPFDPAERWGVEPVHLRRGRHGHRVRATVNGVSFETSIVPRSKRYWLELDPAALRAADVSGGDDVAVTVTPLGL
jgi:uncharacterized protein DUF1905